MSIFIKLQRGLFFSLAAGLFSLLLFEPSIPLNWQVYSLVILVILTGLPHGALDPLVAKKARIWTTPVGLFVFIFNYLALGALTLVLWLTFPGLALLLFLLYSGYHFSGDWRHQLHPLLRIGSGMFIVTASALFQQEQTYHYFALLASKEATEIVLPTLQVLAFPSTLCLAVAAFSVRLNHLLCLELLALLAAGILLPPLMFFMLYFCASHSPKHLIHVSIGYPLGVLVKTALTFTVAAVFLGVLTLFITGTVPIADGLLQVLFIGLAVLTVPHMLLVEWADGLAGNN